jgi:ribonuclease P protein component
MTKLFSLRKSDILRLKLDIEKIFKEGKSVRVLPLKVLWRISKVNVEGLPMVMFVVSKRTTKLAVNRNRIKRLMREAYRLEKPMLLAKLPSTIEVHIAFLYQPVKDLPSLDMFRQAFLKIFEKLPVLCGKELNEKRMTDDVLPDNPS